MLSRAFYTCNSFCMNGIFLKFGGHKMLFLPSDLFHQLRSFVVGSITLFFYFFSFLGTFCFLAICYSTLVTWRNKLASWHFQSVVVVHIYCPSCSGKSSQIPLILSPSQQGQEAPKLLSSSTKSNISANVISNVPMDSSLNTIPVHQAEDHTGENLKL